MRVYRKSFLGNLVRVQVDPHEFAIRFLALDLRWKHRMFDPGKPCSNVEPYAYIRVHNEKPTLKCCLNSILPAITKGIIGYNDCSDGSEEIILDFCRKNPGFMPAKHDYYNLYPDEPDVDKRTRYCNWVLSLMPINEWIVLIDADHIYDPEKLKAAFKLPRTTKDVVYLPRLSLHCDGGELFAIREEPFQFPYDHFIIFNDFNLVFMPGKTRIFEELMVLDDFQRTKIMAEISSWHFSYLKKRRNIEKENLVLFDEWMQNNGVAPLAQKSPTTCPSELLDPKMLDKERIMNYVRQFDLD